MASPENLLVTAIYNEAHDNDALWDSVGGRFSFGMAPDGIAKPYITYDFGGVGNIPAFANDSPVGSEIPIYFHVFNTEDFPGDISDITDIQDKLHTVFDGASLALTGYANLKLLRSDIVNEIMLFEDDTKMWSISVPYRGFASPS